MLFKNFVRGRGPVEGTGGGGCLNESVFIRRRENLSFALALEVLVFKFPYNLNTEPVYITQVSLQFTKVHELSFCVTKYFPPFQSQPMKSFQELQPQIFCHSSSGS